MTNVGRVLFATGVVSLPIGVALWPLSLLLAILGTALRERRIGGEAETYFADAERYELDDVIDHWR